MRLDRSEFITGVAAAQITSCSVWARVRVCRAKRPTGLRPGSDSIPRHERRRAGRGWRAPRSARRPAGQWQCRVRRTSRGRYTRRRRVRGSARGHGTARSPAPRRRPQPVGALRRQPARSCLRQEDQAAHNGRLTHRRSTGQWPSTGRQTVAAATAPVEVNHGRLVRIELDDRFGCAGWASRTWIARPAEIPMNFSAKHGPSSAANCSRPGR